MHFVKRLRFLGGPEENYEKYLRIASVSGEIRSGHLLNTSQEGYRSGNHNILTAYEHFRRNISSELGGNCDHAYY